MSVVQQIYSYVASHIVQLALGVGLIGAVLLYVGMVTGPNPKSIFVLDPLEWRGFKLIAKDALSHNTALYKFELPNPNAVLGLPIGQHISVAAEINGKDVIRSYTPTTSDEDKGHFDLVVKTYEKGNISRYLSLLTIGQEVRIKGPKGKFQYSRTLAPHLLMIAGGTGITPMYQILKAALSDRRDQTELALIYANVEEDDILLRKELEALEAGSKGRFKLYYVLNKPPANWSGGVGFVTQEMIEKHMPLIGAVPGSGKVLMCGPPPMLNAMKAHLAAIGYPAPRTVSKLEDTVFCF